MARECKVAQLQCAGTSSLAEDLAWLQDNQVTHFVECGGDLVSGHGVFVGDEFDLWPTHFGFTDKVDGKCHPREDRVISRFAQWYVDVVGIPVVSHTDGKVYSPAA